MQGTGTAPVVPWAQLQTRTAARATGAAASPVHRPQGAARVCDSETRCGGRGRASGSAPAHDRAPSSSREGRAPLSSTWGPRERKAPRNASRQRSDELGEPRPRGSRATRAGRAVQVTRGPGVPGRCRGTALGSRPTAGSSLRGPGQTVTPPRSAGDSQVVLATPAAAPHPLTATRGGPCPTPTAQASAAARDGSQWVAAIIVTVTPATKRPSVTATAHRAHAHPQGRRAESCRAASSCSDPGKLGGSALSSRPLLPL